MTRRWWLLACALAVLAAPRAGEAHPMGNFSISHYSAIRVLPTAIELRYLLDLAEIPTFQEIQDAGLVPQAGHASLTPYLARAAEALADGLVLEVNGRRLALERGSREVLFTPGAGDLPTMKLSFAYRAALDGAPGAGRTRQLVFRDLNYPQRTGWKEVIATAAPGVGILEASVPDRDRSRALADYPTDLLDAPPQIVAATLTFTSESLPTSVARTTLPAAGARPAAIEPPRPLVPAPTAARAAIVETREIVVPAPNPAAEVQPIGLEPNRRGTPRDAFTALIAAPQLNLGVLVFAALVAAGLGALHALEPGHGKTVVAAYLVGSRGTARHALILGLIVTASHTAGVYLLGAVTLYASRYIVPERLYPWLGVTSGLVIAGLGFTLFLRRYAARSPGHHHHHHHHHAHAHDGRHGHTHEHHAGHHHHGHDHAGDGPISLKQLLALGVTGGIVPCPAALVVLLSAIALRRVGVGLFLIAAFSVGLAAVLIAIGLLMVYARRFMARFTSEGRVVTRWLPLTSSAVIAVLGIAISVQALIAAGILQIHLG